MSLTTAVRGAGLGVINTFLTYPFDTLKVQVQADKSDTSIQELYGGVVRKIVYGSLFSCIIFSTRQVCFEKWSLRNVYCSGLSGAVAGLFMHIIDIIRIGQQIGKPISLEIKTKSLLFTLSKETLQATILNGFLDTAGNFVWVSLLSGIITSVVIYPIDNLRTNYINGRIDQMKIGAIYKGYTWYLIRTFVSALTIKTGSYILNLS